MKQKAIVIGAGVIGCSLADELTKQGVAVTLIDSAEAGSGTSAATFAWINAHNKTPAEYAHLNVLGLEAHERSAQTGSRAGGRWFHQTGTVQIAQSDSEMTGIEAKVAKFQANDYSAKLLSSAEVQELEPALSSPNIVGGAIYAKEGWIDVQTMCLSLLSRALEGGATFAPYETVTDIGTKYVTTRSTDGTVRQHDADLIILAAGNGTRKILATGGINFPTLEVGGSAESPEAARATVGIISTTGPVDSGIRHLVRAEGIAMRPARNGGITFADHPTGGKWELADPRIWTIPGILLDRARQLYPSLEKTATETVSLGTRVLPEDGLTIADWITDDRSVYAVATHSGVTLSAHLAQSVVEEVLTGTRHASLEPFGLSRFATT